MRHHPLAVDGVAGEAAAELVVQPAARHRLAGRVEHRARPPVARPPRVAEQQLQDHRRRELGRASEPAVQPVELSGQPSHRRIQHDSVHGRGVGHHRALQVLAQVGRDPAYVVGPGGPGLRDRLEHLAERRHPAARPVGEVGAREERVAVVVEHHRHRPPAVPGHRGGRLHVDRVDVRALLAVDLDADEVLVEVRRGVVVLERLVRHHVAPVAGGVADAQEYRDAALAGIGERVVTPLPPVDGVVGVLEEVGRGRAGEPVGHAPIVPPSWVQGRGLLRPGWVDYPVLLRPADAVDRSK